MLVEGSGVFAFLAENPHDFITMSAPFSRAYGRQATTVYSGRGADIVMKSTAQEPIPLSGNGVNQTLCQVGVEVSDSAVLRLNCIGSFTASIAATNQAYYSS